MSRVRRVRGFVQQKYESVKNLDVHDSWFWVLTSSLAINKRPEDQRKRLYVYNITFSILYILNCVRYAFAFASGEGHNAHLLGKTLDLVGTNLVFACAACVFAQCCFYRLILIRLIMTDGMIVPQTLRNIVEERYNRLRESKTKMARIVLFSAVTGFAAILLGGSSLLTGSSIMHLLSSNLPFEALCWLMWWVNDMFFLVLGGLDMALFPAMWLLIILNYRMDVVTLTQGFDQAFESGGLMTGTTCDNIRYSYMRLVKQAVEVNRMSSLILFSLVLCTTPIFCTALFIFEYCANRFLSVAFVIAVMPMILFPWTLLAIAAKLTSLTEGLHGRLCSLFAEQNGNSHLSLGHRIRLLQMLEQMGSEEQLLAMRKADGQMYTSETLFYYLVDTVLHYTLLLTFDRSMKFH